MKHTSYFNLLDALKEDGCAICFLVSKSIHKAMDDFLYERVNDPGAREETKKSFGFCNRHAWQMQKLGDGLGVAIIYQNLSELLMTKLESIKDNKRSAHDFLDIEEIRLSKKIEDNCMFCKEAEEIEQRYFSVLIEEFYDPQLENNFENSFGLCLPHLIIFLKQCRDAKITSDVLKTELTKLKNLIAELKEFQRKHDYRFIKEGFGKEGNSWTRAIEKFGGKEGIF
ncbi:MAG: hypothetical protein HZC18_05725 [Candidatus Omnitrophica bacterium]|nr:hypothetical protein [Candidatus Omnitrophota bacterium]